MARKSFSGAAAKTNLTADIDSSTLTIPVGSTTGWPDTSIGPFVITIGRGSPTEEKCLIASYTSSTLTVLADGRGYDGTSPQSHTNNTSVEHTFDANTINEANLVVNAVGSVTPSSSSVGDAAVKGTQTQAPAAGDHKHAREAFGTTISTSKPGDTASAGTATTPARADHKHAREATSPGAVTGGIIYYAAASAPVGWLACDGSLVSRTTYNDLFDAIGTTWGAGDGSTTFAVPDLRGRTAVGTGTGASLTARALAAIGGEEQHVLTATEIPALPHTHPIGFGDAVVYALSSTLGLSASGDSHATYSLSGDNTGSSNGPGGGQGHNNMQPWVGLLPIIKY